MKIFFTFFSFVAICFSANATVRTVTCQNTPSHFLPVTVNAIIGDTIHWTWVAGNHIVGPINATNIPSGAVMFNSPIDASNHAFDYVITAAGNYHYVCHPATPHGEDAYIVVTAASGTGVPEYNASRNFSSVYPNPTKDKVEVKISKGNMSGIEIYNILGEKIFQSFINNQESEVELSNLNRGIYFMIIRTENELIIKKVVKE